ncbi:hypothetical protein [Polaribacter porphyrae]|uniref:Uncharacterized protein n=1 Tax=Polaribacter porphyrae TaxID=1137780 RepID=A0A2S7WRM1_9FLAO|nr:hypothetical protein [Polaribacter porphyrae]PQJ80247.1 hypothetical protein BTO18_14140 [Polaribacter porphyrae]
MSKSLHLINKINLSFEIKCFEVLIKSYHTCLSNKIYSIDWEEKTFSSHLVSIMKKCKLAKEYEFTITKEEELEDYEIDNGLKPPNKANPIDIRFHNIWLNQRLDYNVEAKNISASQWKKTSGSIVNASSQKKEYITKGIDRFLTGHFKNKKGCMLAYIVNGSVEEVISRLNGKIEFQKNKSEIIFYDNLSVSKLKIFQSNHTNRNLKHLFFDFVN